MTTTLNSTDQTIQQIETSGGSGEHIMSTNNNNHDNSSLHPPSSSSSSSYEKADDSGMVEIPPPPFLQRSAAEQLLPTTTVANEATVGEEEQQQQLWQPPILLQSASTISAISIDGGEPSISFNNTDGSSNGGVGGNNPNINNGGGGGGVINVDNIFSAILDDTPPINNNNINKGVANNYISNNSIFHNFSGGGGVDSNNNINSSSNNAPLSILIAPKKSSHLGGDHDIHNGNNHSSNYNVIPPYNPTTTTPQQQQQQPPVSSSHHQQHHKRINSLGETSTRTLLSKSMGNTSFLLKNRPIITHSESNDQYDSGGYPNTTSGGGGYNGGGRRNHHQLRTFYSGGGGGNITSGGNSGSNRVRTGSRDYITMNNGGSGSGGVQSIRHAGYLLKRSNLPYEMTTTTTVAASATATPATNVGGNGGGEDEDVVPNELLLNSFSSDGGVEEPSYYTLPFGGVDSSTTSNTAIGYVPQSNVVDSPTNDYDDEDDYDENYEEDQCFCAPLVEFFTGRRQRRRKGNFHDEEHASGSKKKTSDFGSPIIDYSRDDRHHHHHPHGQQRHQGVVYSHQIPLKGPARSDPVPISPRRGGGGGGGEEQEQQPPHSNSDASSSSTNNSAAIESSSSGMAMNNRNISRLISRSYSNGSRLNETTRTSTSPRSSSMKATTTTTSSSTTTAKPNKKYPPPPPDYIDPRDGHIWRAKYCVLEEGILYFYRNAMEGESDEAQAERNESRNFHVVGGAATTTTTNTTSPILPMMERLSSSPSLGSVPIPGATTATATTTSSTTTSLSKMGKKDLFDLSKSPMPMKKSDFFDLRVSSSSSAMNRPGATTTTPTTNTTPTPTLPRQSPISLHHSNSTSTFHHDTDILWEKRVALDCVGAVRSSVQEHGDHAFELLAYGSPDDDNDEQNNDASSRNSGEYHHHQQQQQQIIDRLILRAGSSDDMNTWMFQFHRSLASYMQRIVNSALNNRHHGTNVMRMRPDSPVHQLHQHRRIGTPGGGGANNNAMNNNKHKIQQASSPMGSSFGSAYSPGIGPSLSHGHGRNAIYRRQVREHAGDLTPGGSPIAGPSIQMIVKSDSIDSQKKAVGMLGLRDVRTSPASAAAAAATTTATAKKYIPPHMRHAAPKKYVPPHIRRKMEEASKGGIDSEIATSPEKQIPLNDSIDDEGGGGAKETKDKAQTREDDGTESDTPSDSALSTTSSLLSRLIDDVSNVMSSSNVRRGGCADPTVIVGSILDDMFIPRKASVLENARLEPYGCIGGGFFTSMRYAPVEEEEDSIPFDDDMNNTGSRTFLSGLKWEVGASSECGVRDYNEDAYVVINNLDEMIESQGLTSFAKQDVGQTMQQGLFAIFDGHVGNQAARFSAEKFPELLMEEQSALASRDSAILSSIEDRTLEVLRNAFDRLDKEFCSLCTRDGRNWDCGSTALAALVVDDVVTLANLGDCRGVVCRVVSSGSAETTTDDEWQELDPEGEEDMLWDRANGAFSSGERMFWREVTETHSPLLSEEEERIRAANGWIIHETEIPTGQIHRMDIFDDDVVDILQRCFADRLGQHRSDPARSIQIARTCGDLAVSRAIGDRDFKAAYNLPRNTAHVVQTQTIVEKRTEIAMSWEGPPVFIYPHGHSGRFKGDLVSSVPDVKFFRIGEKGVLDEFLLMACDGLWDVMDGDDAVRIAKNLLFDKKLSAKDGAERLAELAKHLGSSDNITVILIRFYWEEIDKK